MFGCKLKKFIFAASYSRSLVAQLNKGKNGPVAQLNRAAAF